MASSESLLCFFPEADLLDWYSMELSVAQAAQGIFSKVAILGCSGSLRPICAVMLAASLDIDSSNRDRDRTCRSCIRAKSSAQRQLGLTWADMRSFEVDDDRQVARRLSDAATHGNYLDLEFKGIPVGRYATYLPHLSSKGAPLDQEQKLWRFYLAELETVVRTILMSERAFEALAPTAVVTSNNLYGSHRAFLAVARTLGIERWCMAPGGLLPGRSHSLGLFPEELSGQTVSLSRGANQSLESPLTDFELPLIKSHMRALRGGTDPWVYSSPSSGMNPAQVRKLVGVRATAPVVTVLLASPDEMESSIVAKAEFRVGAYAGTVSPRNFLDGALDCARQLQSVDFVFRIHPRMVANKRESVTSPSLAPLIEVLNSSPPNVHLCHPDLNLSLYDNILISDAAINYTSTSGLEFMSLGLPVVHADDMRLGVYPASLGVPAAGVDDLPRAVLSALASGWSIENAKRSLRWWAISNVRLALFPFLSKDVVPGRSDVSESVTSQSWPLATLVPSFIKRRLGSAHMWVERRRFAFRTPAAGMTDELRLALQSRAHGDIWEPHLFSRGSTLPDEVAQILQLLASAAEDLGWRGAYGPATPGIGAVSNLLRAIEDL